MPRAQDVLFGILGLVVVILATFHLRVAVLGLVGAFACGSVYVFAGMLPARTDSFWGRVFVSVFLSIVVSSLVLILPGTFGLRGPHPGIERLVIVAASLLPLAAICFEILRTPRVAEAILRCLARCLGQR
jgi:hypothetical protein